LLAGSPPSDLDRSVPTLNNRKHTRIQLETAAPPEPDADIRAAAVAAGVPIARASCVPKSDAMLNIALLNLALLSGRVGRRATVIMSEPPMPTTPEGWMTDLSEQQFSILRKGHTEPPGYSENFQVGLEWCAPGVPGERACAALMPVVMPASA